MICMPNLSLEEIAMLESAWSEDEWKSAVNRIRLAREGQLPPDWDDRVVAAGLQEKATQRFSGIILKDAAALQAEQVA